MTQSDALLFFTAVFAATISPGPNILILLTYSLRYGWTNSLFTIMGNLTSLFFQTAIAAFGFGAIVTLFQENLQYFKIAGAIYLFYLGIRVIYNTYKSNEAGILTLDHTDDISVPRFNMAKDAFLVSITNPKALLFQAAIFPQFLRTDSPIVPQFFVMFFIILATVAAIHIGYSYFAERIFGRLSNAQTRHKISYVSGIWFILFGAMMLAL